MTDNDAKTAAAAAAAATAAAATVAGAATAAAATAATAVAAATVATATATAAATAVVAQAQTNAPHAPRLTRCFAASPVDSPLGCRPLRILQLYPREMNIYGDHGNLLTLTRRLQWRGLGVEVVSHHAGQPFPRDVDILLGGGGQDSGQATVKEDLRLIGGALRELVEQGTPALVGCGTYQLFGNYFQTVGGEMIEGLGIFDLHTVGGKKRLIGNIVTHSEHFGEIVGYENHSGKTYLAVGEQPFATVHAGAGNNGEDGTEGVRHHNAIGTYLHGPLLPKNPAIADFLIATALKRRFGEGTLETLGDTLAKEARRVAKTRPR